MAFPAWFERLDIRITEWMARHGLRLLRISIGVVFFWFGFLKFFPGMSPAQELAGRTIERITLGAMSPDVALPVLAAWECAVGLGLIFGVLMRVTLLLLFLQMPGTLLPVLIFPDQVFLRFPFALTLEGQYIVKNFVLISGALALGATVRGGGLVADPAGVRSEAAASPPH
jgi:uncharacterized membrane protein YphA (DoxX/SURF4 family)